MRLAYAVPFSNEFTATPLAEDGFLYVTDSWNVLYKIDARSGDLRRIVWRMDPSRIARCEAAAQRCGQPCHHRRWRIRQLRIIATDKETGKVIWESSFSDTPDVTFTATPLAIKDRIIVGAADGDQGVRDWIAGLDAATGKRYLPCGQSDFMSTLGSWYFSACRNRDFHFKNRTGSSTVYLPRKRLSKSGVHGHAS